MSRITRAVTLVALFSCASAFAQSPGTTGTPSVTAGVIQGKAPGARLAAGEVEARAKIVELDFARRLATLRGPKGNLVTVDVPDTVKNFDQVRVGDDVVIRYALAVAAKLEPAAKGSRLDRVETTTAARAPAEALPGGGTVRTVEVVAIIESLDRKAGTATLKGPTRTVTLKVPEGIDVAKLKVGEEVHAVFVEAVMVSVERTPAR
jgi:hypothetical protein